MEQQEELKAHLMATSEEFRALAAHHDRDRRGSNARRRGNDEPVAQPRDHGGRCACDPVQAEPRFHRQFLHRRPGAARGRGARFFRLRGGPRLDQVSARFLRAGRHPGASELAARA